MSDDRTHNPLAALRATMEGPMRAEIAKALPKDIDPDRFIRTAITSVQMNPQLLDADRRSLFGACMKAAQDGLMAWGWTLAALSRRSWPTTRSAPTIGSSTVQRRVERSSDGAFTLGMLVAFSNQLWSDNTIPAEP